jgi:predicted metal-dependent enzyme (double-stranded beta helix superfamily)
VHVSPDRRVSIVALVWLPGQRTPIHDHVSWYVVGIYEGRECEIRYRAVGRHLEEVGSIRRAPRPRRGDRASSKADIHAVTAVGDEPTISIHVYDADIECRGTSIYRRFDDWPVRQAALPLAA